MRVHVRLKEAEGEEKERIQPFEGVVIQQARAAGRRYVHRSPRQLRHRRRAHFPRPFADHQLDRGSATGPRAPRQALLPARTQGQGRAHQACRPRARAGDSRRRRIEVVTVPHHVSLATRSGFRERCARIRPDAAALFLPIRACGAAAGLAAHRGPGRGGPRLAVRSGLRRCGDSEPQTPHRWPGRLQKTLSGKAPKSSPNASASTPWPGASRKWTRARSTPGTSTRPAGEP